MENSTEIESSTGDLPKPEKFLKFSCDVISPGQTRPTRFQGEMSIGSGFVLREVDQTFLNNQFDVIKSWLLTHWPSEFLHDRFFQRLLNQGTESLVRAGCSWGTWDVRNPVILWDDPLLTEKVQLAAKYTLTFLFLDTMVDRQAGAEGYSDFILKTCEIACKALICDYGSVEELYREAEEFMETNPATKKDIPLWKPTLGLLYHLGEDFIASSFNFTPTTMARTIQELKYFFLYSAWLGDSNMKFLDNLSFRNFVRRKTVGATEFLEFLYIVEGLDMSGIQNDIHFMRMDDLVTDVAGILNDLFSLPKESKERARTGVKADNLFLLYVDNKGLTMEQSIEKGCKKPEKWIKEFYEIYDYLKKTCQKTINEGKSKEGESERAQRMLKAIKILDGVLSMCMEFLADLPDRYPGFSFSVEYIQIK